MLFDDIGIHAWWGNCCIAFKCIIGGERNQYANHHCIARFDGNINAFIGYMREVRNVCRYGYRRPRHDLLDELPFIEDYDLIPVSRTEALYEYAILQHKLYWRDRRRFCRNVRRAKRGIPIMINNVFREGRNPPVETATTNVDMLPPNKWTKWVRSID